MHCVYDSILMCSFVTGHLGSSPEHFVITLEVIVLQLLFFCSLFKTEKIEEIIQNFGFLFCLIFAKTWWLSQSCKGMMEHKPIKKD